jgi:hypothetical protein
VLFLDWAFWWVFGAPFCRGHSVWVWAANRLGKGRVTSCSSTACSSTWPNGYSSQRGSNLMLCKPITHSIHSWQPNFHTPFSSIDLWYHHICRIPIFWICMWPAYRGVQSCFPVPREDSCRGDICLVRVMLSVVLDITEIHDIQTNGKTPIC